MPISDDVGEFIQQFANGVLGAVVVRAQTRRTDWRELTSLVQEALAVEIEQLQATVPQELRDAMLLYLLRAAVIDVYQSLLDQAYPDWRAEVRAERQTG